jgi:hypothetical protein
VSTFDEVHVNLKIMIFPTHILVKKEEGLLLSSLINIRLGLNIAKPKMLPIVLLAIYLKMIMFIVGEMPLLLVGLILGVKLILLKNILEVI